MFMSFWIHLSVGKSDACIRGRISRSTLGDANKHRDWRIWADLAQVLIRRARTPYAQDGFAVALDQAASAISVSNPESACCNQLKMFDL
jgi:hypothetical protein